MARATNAVRMTTALEDVLDETSRSFYSAALGKLDENKMPYLVGGAYAFARYTGIERHTKDFGIHDSGSSRCNFTICIADEKRV